MRLIAIAFAIASLATAGCTAFRPITPAPATDDPRFNATWAASEAALKEYRFIIDREDRRAGVITTQPMVGRHWFEFWRPDAITGADVAEGTVNTIYRQATVIVRRLAGEGEQPYVADVIVKTYRSDRPQLQITSTAEAHLMFFKPESLGRSPALSEPSVEEDKYLADLGRDKALEERLAARIDEIRGRYAPPESMPSSP